MMKFWAGGKRGICFSIGVIGLSDENAAAARLVRNRKKSQTATIWMLLF
jgi:hypothetical protein